MLTKTRTVTVTPQMENLAREIYRLHWVEGCSFQDIDEMMNLDTSVYTGLGRDQSYNILRRKWAQRVVGLPTTKEEVARAQQERMFPFVAV